MPSFYLVDDRPDFNVSLLSPGRSRFSYVPGLGFPCCIVEQLSLYPKLSLKVAKRSDELIAEGFLRENRAAGGPLEVH